MVWNETKAEDSGEHTADSSEQNGAWETSGESFVAFGGPSGSSGNRVSDTFFFPQPIPACGYRHELYLIRFATRG
jgi:hypothetical protein